MKQSMMALGVSLFIGLTAVAQERLDCKNTQSVGTAQDLTKYDRELVEIYSTFAYEQVNNVNRYSIGVTNLYPGRVNIQTGQFDDLSFRHLHQMHEALCKVTSIPKGTLTYRGVNSSPEKTAERFKEGAIYRDYSFTSSSLDQNVAVRFAEKTSEENGQKDPTREVLITIESLSGKDISGISRLPDEKEVIFNPDTIFRVQQVTREASGRHLIRLVELDSDKLSDQDLADLKEFEMKRRDALINEVIRPLSEVFATKMGQKGNREMIEGNINYRLSSLAQKAENQWKALNTIDPVTKVAPLKYQNILIENFGEGQ